MNCPKRLSPAQMQAECDKFNARYSVGDKMLCWPGITDVAPVERIITGPASILGGHTPVVYVSGGGGTIALSHVCRTPSPAPLALHIPDAEIPY